MAKGKTKVVAKATVQQEGKGRTIHILTDDARPAAGTNLFAHTHAALKVVGALVPSRPAVRRSALVTLMGPRAVSYHVTQKNLEVMSGGKVRLTAGGFRSITERKVEAALVAKFVALFTKGAADKSLGIGKGDIATASVTL